MKPFKIIWLSLIVVLPFGAKARFEFSPNCRNAYEQIICFQFAKANTQLDAELQQHPDNAFPYILKHYIDFLKVMAGEEEKDFKSLKNNFEPRMQKISANDHTSPWFLYAQAMLFLQNGFARVKFGEYINAGLDINRAYRLLDENNRKFPSFVCNKTGLGMLHTLIGSVPPKYRWAVKSLQFEGTVPQGVNELHDAVEGLAANHDLAILQVEPLFMYTFAALNLSADMPAAQQMAKRLDMSPLAGYLPTSPLLTWVKVRILAQSGNNTEVINQINLLQHPAGQYPFHYLNYLLGVAKMNRLDEDAQYPLLNFLGSFGGKNYIKSAYMYLAWYYLLHDDHARMQQYINRIPLRGNDQVDNDKEALSFANNPGMYQPDLLRARLLFDGGYYARAEETLLRYKPTNEDQKLEATYRKARVYDKWGKTTQAVALYQQTVTMGSRSPRYFAANAALNLGILAEKAGKKGEALKYFENVLEMPFSEYHFSITNKAEAGISRVKNSK